LVLVLLAAIQFATTLDFLIILPLGPQYMRVMHITPAQFNLIVAAYAIAAGVSGVAAGFFLDRFDRKTPSSGSSWRSPPAPSCARWPPPTTFWWPPGPLPAPSAA
jgi:MFS family permease